ncbi:spermatogenesis-associated protein 1 isoform X1 [Marmota monax]|uniref:spermatogenesis-associated protein 1 isoform X1 n=1 Tax=Marmota monax TaxID=9995 RepID=UPI001EAFB28A|nr:spermatogenesis-associated protein 1 isoform X1 [Marmota monax]XP_046299199.1 spermatogenesis-associated protein 1 isoform X1 [Marmota monax]XP_046299200.1 spermatogenesis-associated protein 1 isoform X1 [Marmota monax]XP_046299201.1 spermatogenesis-associated protein 1 isoform X1 [Marmota monax]XP_058434985.1 spermatogenesis-associated protein 1 isoform X1 [Marmota monax]XP_058434986.1 spermatogenesis-associated protein 1 isoform X1 [Marmota monax]XP_058434987.1 spermatogenesis-associated
MKREKKTRKNPAVQTLVSMSHNPSQPSSSELVELHVFYVPEGSWNYKLNTISIEVINKFISAGFIRVSPQLTLQALRLRLGEFLGEDAVAEKFLFLKCIGNNLAVVKEKQEPELKLISFAPPYALQPELYLLPVMDHLGNVYSASSSVTLDGQQTNSDIAEIDGTIHRPVSATLSKEELGKDPNFLENTLKDLINTNQEEAEEIATPKESQIVKYHIGNSELPGSLENSNDYFTNKKSQFLWKNEEDTTNSRRQDSQTGEKDRITLPDLTDFPSFPCQPVLSSGIPDIPLLKIEREKIIEQMKQVKEERRYLERIRDELIKKVEKLFDQSKGKRYHAFDGWKKKYLETKKVTASLEEVLTKLRDDLELYYKKLLMQLEAREIKMRPKNLANITDSKNNLIIQITEVQHAIDQLKRKLDTDKMKLIIEVKMRKQAASDLRTLKAEMAQKKTNTSLQSQSVPGSVPS